MVNVSRIKMKIIFTMFIAILPFVAKGEIAQPASKEFEIISIFTGLHSSFNHDKSLEFRVFEADGSASIAYNPTYLYLVVTNNLPGHENQTKVVKLPSVAEVTGVTFNKQKNQIFIKAKFDKGTDKGIISSALTGSLKVSIKVISKPEKDFQIEVEKQ